MVGRFNVPPGFKFDPHDHELITILDHHIKGLPLSCDGIIHISDLYDEKEPWEIFQEFGVKKSAYFFTPLKLKKENGVQIVRRIGVYGGSWQADNKGKDVKTDPREGQETKVIGVKKTFSYRYSKKMIMQGSNKDDFKWLMTEFTLKDVPAAQHYAVCLIRKKSNKNDDSDVEDGDEDDDVINLVDQLVEADQDNEIDDHDFLDNVIWDDDILVPNSFVINNVWQ